MSNNNNIVILGCGLSGMITALALAKYDIPSTIVEAQSTNQKFFDDIRTTAINDASRYVFEKIGIWQELLKLCGPINDIYVVDNKAPEMLHFLIEDNSCNKKMGYLIENMKFKKCLYDLVKENKFITILDNIKYQKINNNLDYCELTLSDNSKLVCKLLIACDGKNSRAKNLFFSNDIAEDYKQKALTFIVGHERNHEGTAVEHFMPRGPFAILPLKDPYKSSIVWTVPESYASALLTVEAEEFTYLVQENFGSFLGKIKIQSKIAVFPLKAYTARKYYNNSIALVADTAHVIHPLAGQGLNQGIKDIDSLTSLIAGNGINKDTLINYQKLRQDDNKNMLLITDVINSIFSSNSKIFHSTRQLGFKAIENIPHLKRMIIKYAMGERGK
ncbi:2-octaprenylphenol hydroxylase [Candidatus Megaera polyxenophila]|nr:2-octaprenylphenol hydroxylase [Candidatus Megaera polyxenophila]